MFRLCRETASKSIRFVVEYLRTHAKTKCKAGFSNLVSASGALNNGGDFYSTSETTTKNTLIQNLLTGTLAGCRFRRAARTLVPKRGPANQARAPGRHAILHAGRNRQTRETASDHSPAVIGLVNQGVPNTSYD